MKGFLQFFMQRLGYMGCKKASQCFKDLKWHFCYLYKYKNYFFEKQMLNHVSHDKAFVKNKTKNTF